LVAWVDLLKFNEIRLTKNKISSMKHTIDLVTDKDRTYQVLRAVAVLFPEKNQFLLLLFDMSKLKRW
jgi:hypothetical protein